MTDAHSDPSARVRGLDDLLVVFHDAQTPRQAWRIGTEAEKPGITPSGKPIPFAGDRGLSGVLRRLHERHAWEPSRETPDGPIIALKRGASAITLEPGAQLELSGAPYATIHEVAAEFDVHRREVTPLAEELGVQWLGVGFHPTAEREDYDWVPKLRYGVMREYLPTKGSMALDMMLSTATVQANLDYASEADAMRKLRAALRIQPLITAMFANSPWHRGHDSGYCSYRALAWLHMDPDRSGLLPFAWGDHARYIDYVQWALDAPMFLFRRGAQTHYNTGQTFRAFMQEGFAGHHPSQHDWLVHLATLFPEVRLKQTLEIRGADVQPLPALLALPALSKGLFYDDKALNQVETLSDGFVYEQVQQERPRLAEHGVRTRFQGRDMVQWAGDLLEIAEGGLARAAALNTDGQDETHYLAPIRNVLAQDACPADLLRKAIPSARPSPAQLMAHCGW